MKDTVSMEKVLHEARTAYFKEHIIIRLMNTREQKEILKDAVYRVIGDVAMVLCLHHCEVDGTVRSFLIRREELTRQGLEKEKALSIALKNMLTITPPRIYVLEKFLFSRDVYKGEIFMDREPEGFYEECSLMTCVSTTLNNYGAAIIFAPGVAERLAELYGCSFYMAFTSLHEVMIHPDTAFDLEDLQSCLEGTIEDAVEPEDFLSFHIYHYDKDSGQFTCVTK